MNLLSMRRIIVLALAIGYGMADAFSQDNLDSGLLEKIDNNVRKMMQEGDIPGLSLVIIHAGRPVISSFGYSNLEKKTPVTPNTLFEIGSCTKAFTALATLQLAEAGALHLDAYVSDYLPWFIVKYKDSAVKITLRQVLHHTSGIPWKTISLIPRSNDRDALEQTVKKLTGTALRHLPGKKYEYATIHYDILALIIQQVTKQEFEAYVQEHILNKLQLHQTSIGTPWNSNLMASGYKTGFFKPREYKAPVYRGNYAAGYIITDANDMARWLRFQMGLVDSSLYRIAQLTHQRDEDVPLHNMSSYAMGWEVSLSGNKEIYHEGVNPNYTAYISFRPGTQLGVAVLTNSNSRFTPAIGNRVMQLLAGEKPEKGSDPGDGNDKAFSVVSFVIAGYCLVSIVFLGLIIVDIIRRKRTFEGFSVAKLRKLARSLLLLAPFVYGLYLLPEAIAGFTWESIIVWTPVSFVVMALLIMAAMSISYLNYFISLWFPEKDRFRRIAPMILLLSMLSGISNMVVVILVTSSLETDMDLGYLIFYYVLTLSVYLLGRRFVQISLIRFTMGLIYELRMKLIGKIFSTSYQRFEKIDRGRIYTTINDDIEAIGASTNTMVMLVTSIITATGAFLYLGTIAFWAAILTVLLIASLSVIYYFVSKSTRPYYEGARDSRNVFLRLIGAMTDGFKEISLHRNKRLEFKADVSASAVLYRDKIAAAETRFVNAFLVGESLLLVLLGLVAFAMPKLFPGIESYTIMSFVIVLLYLIGPINAILNAVPAIMRLRVGWRRITKFMKDIPANLDLDKTPEPVAYPVESIRAEGLMFQYKTGAEQEGFGVGPINLEVKKGEIVFIIGGNGSGKTTLAKLLTGLYAPDEGRILINNKAVEGGQLSECFSAVFSPSYLFDTLYNIDIDNKAAEAKIYLKLLGLEEKVSITGRKYSTISLSGGQRKRLALLQCYLEGLPIYLFDEWAADQDPVYRNFFYRTLLPEMKKAGKIVIAITHDDHYFDVADRVYKMKQGKIKEYDGTRLYDILQGEPLPGTEG